MNVGNVAFLKQKSISLLRNKVCYTPKEEKSVQRLPTDRKVVANELWVNCSSKKGGVFYTLKKGGKVFSSF